jgi:2-C-methyl-D-erythritol 4-phosphate cytidylyltransferase
MTESTVWALVPASGVGTRMQSAVPKQYLRIAGKTVLEHTLDRISACPSVTKMMVAISPQDNHYIGLDYAQSKLDQVIEGGVQRADSVRNMLTALVVIDPNSWALVHDAVRPCVRIDDVERLIKTATQKNYGGLLGAPMADTVKQVNVSDEVVKSVPRESLWRAFTPQLFRASELLASLENGANVTDEASAIENAGGRVFMLEGSPDNLKITRPADLALAQLILKAQFGQNT